MNERTRGKLAANGRFTPLSTLLRLLKSWVWSLGDSLPPYRTVEGPLETKETDSRGKFYIYVGSAKVEVDKATFDALVVGESLRVRHTRGYRGINIDRLHPGKGPG